MSLLSKFPEDGNRQPDMKKPIALFAILLTLSSVLIAQVISKDAPLQASKMDLHMITVARTFRYDSRSGATQMLIDLPNTGYSWAPVEDIYHGPAGENGRYEIQPISTIHGYLVRLDTKTGKTWILQQRDQLHWVLVTKQ